MKKIKKVFTAIKNMAVFFFHFDRETQNNFFGCLHKEVNLIPVRDVFYRQFAVDHSARLAREKELEDIRKHNAEVDAARRAKLAAGKTRRP